LTDGQAPSRDDTIGHLMSKRPHLSRVWKEMLPENVIGHSMLLVNVSGLKQNQVANVTRKIRITFRITGICRKSFKKDMVLLVEHQISECPSRYEIQYSFQE